MEMYLGAKVPYFVDDTQFMIEKRIVQEVVEKQIAETSMFLVELTVSADSKISVIVDSMQGVSLDMCVKLNKEIEQYLDRDREDFELQVSSAGIGQKFKVKKQYYKNVGREVEVLTVDGIKIKGKLLTVTENGIEIEVEKMLKKEGEKRKSLTIMTKNFDFDQIKSTKDIITI